MDSAKSQLIERLKSANTILITVSRNPSVDQLAACIGLTLIINKLKKHGSAVFSGDIPSTIEFLKPEDTLEKTTDSLRDFIIALDKNKADKLRYKVEDQVVKIFITPYRTSLTEEDLEFSQGDFNVELIIALGVQRQEELDQAIISHGRILHDATVSSINTNNQSELGTINWIEPTASSLCELVTSLAYSLGNQLVDEQIATALLTGIIAETDRFSNEKTTSQTMSVSAQLMAAGANQQLVASKLAEKPEFKAASPKRKATKGESEVKKSKGSTDDGTLNIDHQDLDLSATKLPPPSDLPDGAIASNQANAFRPAENVDNLVNNTQSDSLSSRMVTQPPSFGGTLTANSEPSQYDPSTDPLTNIMAQPGASNTLPSDKFTLPAVPTLPTTQAFTPPPSSWTPPSSPSPPPVNNDLQVRPEPPKPDNVAPQVQAPNGQSLTDIEQQVNSSHQGGSKVSNARDQVDAVLADTVDELPKPAESLNALPLGEPLHEDKLSSDSELKDIQNTTGLDPNLFSEPPARDDDTTKAPPVPPPLPQLPDDNNPVL